MFSAATVAVDVEPVFPGLSADDVLTLYWTKATNRPDVSTTAKVLSLLSFSPPLASVLRATWQSGGDAVVLDAAERLVITLSGTVNSDIPSTLVPLVRITVLPSAGLRDAAGGSQNATIVNATVTGTWGDADQPQFLTSAPLIALDYGGQPGLGAGDALVLRFNQPVRQVLVATKADLDALLVMSPPDWATDYNGTWLDFTTLLVTAVSVNAASTSSASFRAATAVGALRVVVLPSGGLTSLDGTGSASNTSGVVTAGSWGDAVCDGGVFVYSHTSLAVGFMPPVNASVTPLAYSVQVSGSAAFPAGGTTTVVVGPGATAASVALPTSVPAAALRYLLPRLVTDTPYFVRVAVVPPVLPAELTVLPQAVALVHTAVGSGGCSCAAVSSGLGCGAVLGASVALAPQLPVVGTWGHGGGVRILLPSLTPHAVW